MAIFINTNSQSIFTQRTLGSNTSDLQKSIEKLSTGFRINRAADDAAGLSISEKLTAQIRGLDKAEQNIGDGISMVQTAEAGLSIVHDNLQRIRELVVQGSNGTNGTNELNAIQREINARIGTIADVGVETEFNNITLLDGSTNLNLQTGAYQGQTTTLDFQSGVTANTGVDIDVSFLRTGTAADSGHLLEGIATAGFALDRMQIAGASVDSVNGTNVAITLDDIDVLLDNVSRMRSELGAVQNSLESKAEYINIARENAMTSRSRIKDADIARESSILVSNQILQQSAAAMLAQANQTPQLALSLLP